MIIPALVILFGVCCVAILSGFLSLRSMERKIKGIDFKEIDVPDFTQEQKDFFRQLQLKSDLKEIK